MKMKFFKSLIVVLGELALPVKVKICGLSQPDEVRTAQNAGADYVGFVCHPPSPRHMSVKRASQLIDQVEITASKVALTVNPTDDELESIITAIEPDWLQLHGNESPARTDEIRNKFHIPVMKACGLKSKDDLSQLGEYNAVVDQILVDAKPVDSQSLPGGNGIAFDWQLISDYRWTKPWMLAGGLNSANVRAAIELTGACQVDVSSGVEARPGYKSLAAIVQFVKAAKGSRNEPES